MGGKLLHAPHDDDELEVVVDLVVEIGLMDEAVETSAYDEMVVVVVETGEMVPG